MEKLYKILVDGKSCHGGDIKWDLPKNGKPGKWHKFKGGLKMCEQGFHLTTKPYEWYKLNCVCYEAEARGIKEWSNDKCVCSEVRLLKEKPHPKWWLDAMKFIEEIKNIPYLKPDGKPLKQWKMFYGKTWDAAKDAAGHAARDAAGHAAGYAAWDAALLARCLVVKDKIDKKHLKHAQDRMEVWRKGYGLLCDVDGVLYVYAKK